MYQIMIYRIFLAGLLAVLAFQVEAQQKQEPWKPGQLMATKVLADRILAGKAENMLIVSIGPDDPIEGSIDIGPGKDKESIAALKSLLGKTPKDKEVVIYCGCCPFDRCPNIRPAFKLMNDMGFKNAKLLDIPRNIKVDWIDKDYPVKEEEN
ncbi:MAG: hypothetical protein ABS46_13455 [Cytophagaceae bacterium SCN 52-12]|nr:MAG: hypothetical protein ABS46_13455 [Cytophagaceae bacterium SCN 52-12]